MVRYNGKHPSEHTNIWEKAQGYQQYKFKPTFHIHKAAQQYQEDGFKIDGYAEITDKYGDFNSTLQHFIIETNFIKSDNSQLNLFEKGGLS